MIFVNPYAFGGFPNRHSWQGGGVNKHLTVGTTSSHKFLHGALDTASFQFSIGFWVKMVNPNSGNVTRFFSTALSTTDVGMTILYRDDGAFSRDIVVQIARGVAGTGNAVFYKDNFTAYPNDSDWHFVLLTYDQGAASNNGEVFIDDVSIGTGNKTGLTPSTANSSNSPFIASANAALQFLNGKLFAFSIWNKKLSTAEGTELYTLGTGNPENLSFWGNRFQYHYFPNGQADYPTWTDLVGSFNATMVNGVAADINTDVP